MLNTNPGITLISIMVFHFSKIGKVVRNQICLDTNPNMYLVANSSVVFLLYTVGSVKIQVWEKKIHVWEKENPSMLTCCHKIHMRFCLFPSMMFSHKFWKSMFGILRIQIGIRTKSMFGKLVLFPCLENIQFPHKFHTISIQNSNWEICQFFQWTLIYFCSMDQSRKSMAMMSINNNLVCTIFWSLEDA